jgi:hypothetical protein
MVSALAFPPAIFGAVAIADSNLGESHDTIIAVDSERTRDVEDLENAIARMPSAGKLRDSNPHGPFGPGDFKSSGTAERRAIMV